MQVISVPQTAAALPVAASVASFCETARVAENRHQVSSLTVCSLLAFASVLERSSAYSRRVGRYLGVFSFSGALRPPQHAEEASFVTQSSEQSTGAVSTQVCALH